MHDAPTQLRDRLILRGRHERLLAEMFGFAVATGVDDRPQVVCAWCSVKIRDGNPALPLSHGICPSCAAEFEAQLQHGGPLGPDGSPTEVSMSTETAASARQIQRTHGGNS